MFKYYRKNQGFCLRFIVWFYMIFFCAVVHTAGAEVVDRIVAVVNDDIILASELNEAFNPYAERIKAQGYSVDKERGLLFKARENMLNQLIDQKLTDQEIKRSNITIDEREIDDTIERLKEQNFFTDEDLRKALAREGLTLEAYRKRIKENMLRSRLVNFKIKSKVVITKEDARAYYERHRDKYGVETKYHLRNIIMKVSPSGNDEDRLAVLRKMEAVLEKLKQGQPFETLAGRFSESTMADTGGDLGFFRIDELSPQLQEEIKGKNAGEFTTVIDTDQGYQIFFVEEITKVPGKSFEEVSAVIEEELYHDMVDKKFQSWLAELRKRSHIKVVK